MKRIHFMIFIFLFGCSSERSESKKQMQLVAKLIDTIHVYADKPKEQVIVRYYDRNGDGMVDKETHNYPNVKDANWMLSDENYDGRYDKKTLFGIALEESVVDIRVPRNVRIESNEGFQGI